MSVKAGAGCHGGWRNLQESIFWCPWGRGKVEQAEKNKTISNMPNDECGAGNLKRK